jgi:hypothetical protein
MLNRLKFLAVAVASFLPDSVAAKLNTKPEVKERRLDIICPPRGFKSSIAWDANDVLSVAQARVAIADLLLADPRRAYYFDEGNGKLGKRIKTVGDLDLQNDIITIPEIYGG